MFNSTQLNTARPGLLVQAVAKTNMTKTTINGFIFIIEYWIYFFNLMITHNDISQPDADRYRDRFRLYRFRHF